MWGASEVSHRMEAASHGGGISFIGSNYQIKNKIEERGTYEKQVMFSNRQIAFLGLGIRR